MSFVGEAKRQKVSSLGSQNGVLLSSTMTAGKDEHLLVDEHELATSEEAS